MVLGIPRARHWQFQPQPRCQPRTEDQQTHL